MPISDNEDSETVNVQRDKEDDIRFMPPAFDDTESAETNDTIKKDESSGVYCKHCGNLIHPEDVFCKHCGNKQ